MLTGDAMLYLYIAALAAGIIIGLFVATALHRWLQHRAVLTADAADWETLEGVLTAANDADPAGTIALAQHYGMTPWLASLAIIEHWRARDLEEEAKAIAAMPDETHVEDAIDALITLGYDPVKANDAATAAYTETGSGNASELVKHALARKT